MSVIVTICQNDGVYMGTDTQTTFGELKFNTAEEMTCKVSRLKNGILLGVCGLVSAHQAMIQNEEIFDLNGNTELTKEYLVNNVVPKIQSIIKDNNFSGPNDTEMPITIMVAYKNRAFLISSDLQVIRITDFYATGAGNEYALYALSNKEQSVRERILNGLRTSAAICDSVSKPFMLIDTVNQTYEKVEE